jgi:hypothetical protein
MKKKKNAPAPSSPMKVNNGTTFQKKGRARLQKKGPAEEPEEPEADKIPTEAELDAMPHPSQAQRNKFFRDIGKLPREVQDQVAEVQGRKARGSETTHKERDLRRIMNAVTLQGYNSGFFDQWKSIEKIKSASDKKTGVPWGIMVGKHGGSEAQCLAAYKRKEFKQILNPNYKEGQGPKYMYVSPELEGKETTMTTEGFKGQAKGKLSEDGFQEIADYMDNLEGLDGWCEVVSLEDVGDMDAVPAAMLALEDLPRASDGSKIRVKNDPEVMEKTEKKIQVLLKSLESSRIGIVRATAAQSSKDEETKAFKKKKLEGKLEWVQQAQTSMTMYLTDLKTANMADVQKEYNNCCLENSKLVNILKAVA